MTHADRPACHQRQRGFTLIEVLVALAIIGVALAAASRAVATLTQNNGALQDRALAQISAENRLADIRLDPRLARKGSSVAACPQGKLALVCHQRIRELPNGSLEAIVEVYIDQQVTRLAVLSSVLPVPTAAP